MGPASSDSRRMQRRDSSPRSSSKRRPKLLRAVATEPSITPSNASRNALASSHSCGRATDLLNRVAYISGSPPDSVTRSASPLSARSPMYDRQGDLSSSPSSHSEGFENDHPHHHSTRYFSFPRFDLYEGSPQEEEDKEAEMKSP
ncbi:hypothetical protein QBC33DRAFT_272286 [Phialemonium atrogriseum]|uniref:Uncharacterized protein n=1 Tax=Phialemonium atrogriseum TaxID=1093897 RepID=A0AAJ0C5J6_9PEZI|nr:uncharacterized protein QBC33DRAFT_272286 [Phialemonium atrogriseum]KAK1770574.1 hypothetical protein QBC33DRAFT_272286 [Phialemonium atrogriseum]